MSTTCPNNCHLWARGITLNEPMTFHHPDCEHVDSTLIDVWRVSYGDRSYVIDAPPLTTHQGETVTQEKMHREIYENLKEFNGF